MDLLLAGYRNQIKHLHDHDHNVKEKGLDSKADRSIDPGSKTDLAVQIHLEVDEGPPLLKAAPDRPMTEMQRSPDELQERIEVEGHESPHVLLSKRREPV